MAYVIVNVSGEELRGRIMPHDSGWQDAAGRALRRRFGRHAEAWRWNCESSAITRDGDVKQNNWRSTVAGKGGAVICDAWVYRPVRKGEEVGFR